MISLQAVKKGSEEAYEGVLSVAPCSAGHRIVPHFDRGNGSGSGAVLLLAACTKAADSAAAASKGSACIILNRDERRRIEAGGGRK